MLNIFFKGAPWCTQNYHFEFTRQLYHTYRARSHAKENLRHDDIHDLITAGGRHKKSPGACRGFFCDALWRHSYCDPHYHSPVKEPACG